MKNIAQIKLKLEISNQELIEKQKAYSNLSQIDCMSSPGRLLDNQIQALKGVISALEWVACQEKLNEEAKQFSKNQVKSFVKIAWDCGIEHDRSNLAWDGILEHDKTLKDSFRTFDDFWIYLEEEFYD